jgi:hypothetical protein
MQRVRRLALIAVVTVAGLLAVAGCRANADVAAYVGKATYAEDEITRLYDDAYAKFVAARKQQGADPGAAPGATPSARPEPKRSDLPLTRQDIVVALVGRDMFKGAAEQRGIKPLTVPPQQLAESKPLPLDSDYMKTWAEHEGYRFALLQSLPRKTPTDADLRGIFDTLVKGGGVESSVSFTQFATSLNEDQQQTVAAVVALRDALAAQVKSGDVVVNPRYTPAEVSLLDFPDAQQARHPLVTVPLETDPGEPFVRDAS